MAKPKGKTSGTSKGASTKADNARALAAALKQKQADRDKQQRLIVGGILAVIAIALIGVIAWLIFNNPSSAKNLEKNVQESENVPSIFNADGSITFGKKGAGEANATPGATTVDLYHDFMCPGCGAFENANAPMLQQLVNSGEINLRLHPLGWLDSTSPLPPFTLDANQKNDGYSSRAQAAAIYIAQNAPDKYLAFMAAMYKPGNQPSEGVPGKSTSGGYDPATGTDAKIVEHALEAGVPKAVAEASVKGEYAEYARRVSQMVSRLGKLQGTPSIWINDKEYGYFDYKGVKNSVPTTEEFKADILAGG
jgi:protein-disulfide isomerase